MIDTGIGKIFKSRHAKRAAAFASVSLIAIAAVIATASSLRAQSNSTASTCTDDNGGLSLSPGFCATVFADNVGHVRHMAVAPNGVLYVNTWSGRYFRNVPPPPGGMLVALKDSNGNGTADVIERFGPSLADGSAGGSGIAVYNNAVFAEQNDKIVRFTLPNGANEIALKGTQEVVLSGLPLTGDHPMHPFVIDKDGHIFVDLGSATNACQAENRVKNAPGIDPCTETETRAGIWRYDANKTDQHFSANERYATGIRNSEGYSFDASGHLFATQHGRDQLWQNWPKLYTPEQGADLPAEEIVAVEQGGDYGWPKCYFDQNQNKLVLGPEYGGDGGKTVGLCADKKAPIAAFPGHWAPNDMLIYTGKAFPASYQGGAFVAFHGSWNRAPLPQGGYWAISHRQASN
jgi:glucose/arabinose dehydrogenase